MLGIIFRAIVNFTYFSYRLNIDIGLKKILYFILYYILDYRKKVVEKNLSIIFPNYSRFQIKEEKKKYHRHLAELFLESIWSYRADKSKITPKVNVANMEVFEEIYQSGKNATILLSHIGNWELFCQWASLHIPKLHVIILYTPIKNEGINRQLIQYRERFGAKLISTKSTLDLFRAQKSKIPSINLFAIDQNPGDPDNQYWMNFFNREAPVISGAEKFARSQQQSVYFLHVSKEKNYQLKLIPVAYKKEVEYDITHQQMSLLESNILEDPSLWLLSHNRFKHVKKVNLDNK